MSTTTSRARVAAGVPTGGQFAATARAESSIALLASDPQAFHPGVTNCGGDLAASGCSCASTPSSDGTTPHVSKTQTARERDAQAVDEWLPTASDKHFARLCSETAMWVTVAADHMSEGPSHEPDWHAIRNSYVAGCLARTPHRELPKVLLGEIRNRLATDVGPGADERAKTYEAAAQSFYRHLPGHLGTPHSAQEARGLWHGVALRAEEEERRRNGNPLFRPTYDVLDDPEAIRFAVEDAQCGAYAVEALRMGLGTGRSDTEQFTLRLASSPVPEVRASVAEAVSWHDRLTPVMASDEDPRVRAVMAGRMGHMAGQANRGPLAKDRDLFQGHTPNHPRYERRKALIETSRGLARDPDTGVRRALATSEAWTDEKTQHILADDRDPMVRNVLASRAGLSTLYEGAVKTLAKDPEPGVRENLLASGVTIPHRYLKRLARDSDPAVARAAASRLNPGGGGLSIKGGRIQRDA